MLGSDYSDLDLVFCKPDGSHIHPETFSKTFDRLVRASGVSRIHLHEVRHANATLALLAGIHFEGCLGDPGAFRNRNNG
jgi:site-specific recombinase XerD